MISVLLVNLLTTDFDLNILDENVTEPVEPPESLTRGNSYRWEFYAEVDAVDQITITRNGAGDLLVPVTKAIDTLSQ